MHGLYRPHGPEGESKHGPSARVTCDVLMTKQLQRWLTLILQAGGVSAKAALFRSELEVQPSLFLVLDSDACYADVTQAAVGGICHGLYWLLVVDEADRAILSIPILEFMGVVINILVFHAYVQQACGGGTSVQALLRTDALTAALTLPDASMSSLLLVEAYQWLIERPEWVLLAPHLAVGHLFGDGNPLADLISRQKWAQFHRLCAQLGIRPQRVELPESAHELYRVVVAAARRQAAPAASRAGASRPPEPPSTLASFFVGCNSDLALRRLRGEPVLPSPLSPVPPPASPQPAAPETPPPQPALPGTPPRNLALARLRGDSEPAQLAEPATPKRRHVGDLCLPPPPPPAKRHVSAALTEAGRSYRRQQVLSMAGTDAMAFQASEEVLLGLADSMQENVDYGVNANTAKTDNRAWDLWDFVCTSVGTSPLRFVNKLSSF